ncbi:MAG TPA: hypothetical protein ENI80_11350 [Acidiferrobacteraceae bacterium]|nr:hypothetical protein [Acidiferrobacteraceae bacterium]
MNGTHNPLRNQILEVLEFPRQLVRAELAPKQCPHDIQYDVADPVCLHCLDGPECQWLYATDEVASLSSRSLDELAQALEFAILSVAAQLAHGVHPESKCLCSSCAWLQQADQLHKQAIQSNPDPQL